MSLGQLLIDFPIPFAILGLYLSLMVFHQGYHLRFQIKGPSVGERLLVSPSPQTTMRFRIRYTEHTPDAPLVIFESHLGMPLDVWGYAQRELQSFVSTLAYDRIGYGWSSHSFDQKRAISSLVQDLYLVLQTLGVLENQKDRIQLKKRLILVGHSFGGIVAKAFSDQYNVPLVGLILLDMPPRTLIQSTPKLMDMYTSRLPRIFSIAASLADIGILRIAQKFGVTLFQVTDLMKSRLNTDEIDSIREFSIDGKSMRSAEAELRGFVEYLKETPSAKSNCRVIVIAAEAVQPIMGESSDGSWKEKWMGAQKELSASFPLGELMVDTECESMSLCVSTRITMAVKKMINA